jgi:putative sterol carrier protein
MTLGNITERITAKLSRAAAMNAKVKFDFGEDGRIFVDATQDPPRISHEDEEADVILLSSIDTFEGILNGTQDPNVAFLMGKLKVQGNMGLALKLNGLLEN